MRRRGGSASAAAYRLPQLGHGVSVFEQLPVSGGMMSVGYPESRPPLAVVPQENTLVGGRGAQTFERNSQLSESRYPGPTPVPEPHPSTAARNATITAVAPIQRLILSSRRCYC